MTQPRPVWRWFQLGLAAASVLAALNGSSHAAALTSTGGLSIQTSQRSARSFNANVGFHKTSYIEFQVLHQGKPLSVTGPEGKPLRDFRDAWVLLDAPQPSVLAGDGQSWYLITDLPTSNPKVTRVGGGHQGQVQWIDAPSGPGENFASIQIRTEANDDRSLRGGQRLLLNRSQVLDLRSLRLQALNLTVPAGYEWAGLPSLALSPDGRQLVWLYRGESNHVRDALLLIADTQQPQNTLLSVDLKTLGIEDWQAPTATWLDKHFEWVAGPDGIHRLQPRAARTKADWSARYEYGMAAPRGPQGAQPRYRIWPVKASLLAGARTAVIEELRADPAPARAGDPEPTVFARLSMSVYPVVMRYDAAQRTLVVEAPELDPLRAQSAINYIGELIDAKLAEGAFRKHLADGATAR